MIMCNNMERNDIVGVLTTIFREVFQNSMLKLKEEQLIQEMQLYDDMRFTSMIRKIESAFQIKFNLKELCEVRTVGDIVELVKSKC